MDLGPYKPPNAVLTLPFFTEERVPSLIEDYLPRKFWASQNSTTIKQNKYLSIHNKFSIIWKKRNMKLFNVQDYGLLKNNMFIFSCTMTIIR